MAKPKQEDALETEAKKLGYAELLQRVQKEIEGDTSIRAILQDRAEEIQRRIKELGQ